MTPLLAILVFSRLARPLTICIDPGHPSEVSQGTAGRVVSEVHVAWVVAKKLEAILIAKGVHVVLTKKSEFQMVRNKDRALIANRCHADLMVRLHCDAANGSGFTTYYPDRQGTQHGVTGPAKSVLASTAPVAKRFHAVLRQDLGGFLKDNGLKSDVDTAVGSRYGALIASIYSTVPVVLVEMCVLTNRHDEDLVRSAKGQDRLAQGLADACSKSVGTHRR
jgi:N-acetylmuramoyl-L-alanine amidase